MSKVARGLAALVALVVLTAGLPAALVRYVGRPWPTRLPALMWWSARSGRGTSATSP
ncbi:MAG: hypothetical protein JWN39_2508 [Ilumatobacteraceae bacterium]|nr:hypothetical protein [Ilumatobacteraceae bacterium]